MIRGKSSHIPEFKGIYYNESKDQNIFEGGAHFKYKDLYLILEKLKQTYPYNLNEKGYSIPKNKNAFMGNGTNGNGNKNEPKTRNTQSKIEKSNTKQQLTSYSNKVVTHNLFHQSIQPKCSGVTVYDNNNGKTHTKNKVIIPKPTKMASNQRQLKTNSVKRNPSEDPHQNNGNDNHHKTQPKSTRMYSSNIQKVIEYSDRVKQNNLNSARANLTRNGNKSKSNSNNNNNRDNNCNNNNHHTFAFSNSSAKQVKSRNSNRMTGSDFFNNHSFYTKSECRRKDKKEMISFRHTMDKESLFNKTLMTRKECNSITISTRGKKGYLAKCSQISIQDKKSHHKMNGSIDSQKGRLKKSFLSS